MTDAFFQLPQRDREAALRAAAEALGRPPDILEKDVMVVWALRALYASSFASHLSFKGGTSLSKVYGLITRFSEDIDITYDIRFFLGADFEIPEDGLPPSKSQGKKWTEEVREKLPAWIAGELVPYLTEAAKADGVGVAFRVENKDRLYLDYTPLIAGTTSYVKPAVMLEFGARSTGEPVETHTVACDAAAVLPEVEFPTATVRAMQVGRTFWEKATAAHVYCKQESLKGDRFSRHWHDLHFIAKSKFYEAAVADRDLAGKVAAHKATFFVEKDKDGVPVDYGAAVDGTIVLVPTGAALKALEDDYDAMNASGILPANAPTFAEIMQTCAEIERDINTPAAAPAL